jgi:hypothetical protein
MISKTAKLTMLLCAALLLAAACLPAAALAKSKTNAPRVTTGSAEHILGSSAQLTGEVEPNGLDTSYYFQWGLTTGYGAVTNKVHLGTGPTSGSPKVKVGQEIRGLTPGAEYHFRIVAIYPGPGGLATTVGRDRRFIAKPTPLKFEMPKALKQVVGSPFLLSGTLRGLGAAHHAIALQATTFPYTEPFTTIATPSTTDAAGRFTFRIAHFTSSTQFRVTTLDPRPLYSQIVTAHAQVRVVAHVRKSSQPGLVRLYGTVTPVAVGSPVLIQLSKAIKHPRSENKTTAFGTQFTTVVKRGTKTFSRFSVIVKITKAGLYRVLVKLKPGGAVESGFSPVVYLHAAPSPKKGKTKKNK